MQGHVEVQLYDKWALSEVHQMLTSAAQTAADKMYPPLRTANKTKDAAHQNISEQTLELSNTPTHIHVYISTYIHVQSSSLCPRVARHVGVISLPDDKSTANPGSLSHTLPLSFSMTVLLPLFPLFSFLLLSSLSSSISRLASPTISQLRRGS